MSEAWDGLLPIDKPEGPTSHDIVARVRAFTGVRRVGHTGTLDPPASGLLLLVVGQATRLARFIPGAPKTYRGTLALGITTASDDLTGEVVHRHEGPIPAPEEILAAAALQLGRQLQVPPAVSARHVDGTRLYRLARRGVSVSAPAAEVVIDRFELRPTEAPDRWGYEMVVSTGTYVRSVVRDLGAALGCGAAVASLRRTAVGPFSVDAADPVLGDKAGFLETARRRLIPIDTMPLDLASIALASTDEGVGFGAGRAIALSAASVPEGTLAAVRSADGRLLGVGLLEDGRLKPRVVLPRPA